MSKVNEIKSRIVRINLIDGTKINGQININKGPEGYERLSDLIGNTKEEFLIVFSATAYQRDIENPVQQKVMFINKRHILWASPDEDQK